MSDLEQRLRRRALMHGDYEGQLVNPDGPEAADRLRQYREALDIMHTAFAGSADTRAKQEAVAIARAALKETTDVD